MSGLGLALERLNPSLFTPPKVIDNLGMAAEMAEVYMNHQGNPLQTCPSEPCYSIAIRLCKIVCMFHTST
jgi:hypothetical protein